MHLSRRERIMREVQRRMEEMRAGQPDADPFSTTFGVVTRGSSLEGVHQTEVHGLAILDTEENKTPKINQMDVQLRVVLEFSAWLERDEEPSTIGNRVMADIQRKMREDLHLTEPDDGRPLQDRQLSENLVEAGNQLFIEGFADRRITGAVFYQIRYKHGIDDPRELLNAV